MHPDIFSCGNDSSKAEKFVDSVRSGNFFFTLVMSYTATCEIEGLTIAGADASKFKYTPPADAEYLHYGYCKTIDGIPMTPDGKPTPAIMTRAALESSGISHIAINAGSRVHPHLPFVETGLESGQNIRLHNAMPIESVTRAVDYGRIMGRTLAPLADCLVIGESIPGGTTTAMALLRAMGFNASVSSSMPENPILLKESVVGDALARYKKDGKDLKSDLFMSDVTNSDNLSTYTDSQKQSVYHIAAAVGDPMIPFVAGMLSSASQSSRVMLAGGTQMAAVLAFASCVGFDSDKVAIGTTSYVANDPSADFEGLVSTVSDVPALAVDPCLDDSQYAGLRAFASGYAKEGAGAGGCMISAMLKSGMRGPDMMNTIDCEYERLVS